MRERLYRFMQGRYGVDAFGKFLIYTGLILALINILVSSAALSFIVLAIWIYSYYRILSKNIYLRSSENNRYLNIKEQVTGRFRGFFERFKGTDGNGSYSGKSRNSCCNSYSGKCYDADYKVFKCPSCKQKLRVPKGKGKIRITCRRCQREFIKRT